MDGNYLVELDADPRHRQLGQIKRKAGGVVDAQTPQHGRAVRNVEAEAIFRFGYE